MAEKRSLLADPRYLAFAKRYAFDLTRFAVEVVGMSPTGQQIELFESVSPAGSRTSVSSGHGVGKTGSYGVIGLWHLLCYPHSNTFLSAPKLKTLIEGVGKELATHRQGMLTAMHPWIVDYLVLERERFFVAGHKSTWFGTFRTAPKGSPENLAGSHNAWLLWLIDEASGVPDANFGVIGGSLTDERNRMVCASQPTRPTGAFYDQHHKLNRENGGPWNALVFNSEDSGLVSDSFIRDKLIEYGGRDSPEYQIKVMGRFPENQDGYLLGRNVVERVIDAPYVIGDDEPYGNVFVIDVGAGVYRDKTVGSHFRVIGSGDRIDPDPRRADLVDVPVFTNSLDWDGAARLTVDYVSRLSNCTVIVDVGGQGVQFAKRLEKLGLGNVIHSNWGNPCFKKRNKERFANLRAQACVHAAEAIKDGRMSIVGRYRNDLISQATRIPFFFDERARWKIMSKEDMAKEGIPSPDLFDTIAMLFLESAHYIVAEDAGTNSNGTRQQEALARAMEAFASVGAPA